MYDKHNYISLGVYLVHRTPSDVSCTYKKNAILISKLNWALHGISDVKYVNGFGSRTLSGGFWLEIQLRNQVWYPCYLLWLLSVRPVSSEV